MDDRVGGKINKGKRERGGAKVLHRNQYVQMRAPRAMRYIFDIF